MNKNVFLLALALGVASFTANAQVLNKNTTFKLGGLGRSVLTSDKLSGNIVEGDSVSANKGLGGYTMFDLNADLTVNQIFNANTILRIKNPYGSFYGQDTYFEFRQLQFSGRIGRKLRYELGDVYIGMTPFTVSNNAEPMKNKFESDVFKLRRDILEYENFYVKDKWRLQGIQLFYNLDSVLVFKKIELNAFGVRTNITNENTIPDRAFIGGRANFVVNDKLQVGLNGVGFTDLQVSNTQVYIKNNVFTLDGAYSPIVSDNFRLTLGFEGGMSNSKYNNKLGDTTNTVNDFFYKPEVKVGLLSKLVVGAAYSNVGGAFNSPSAQTQRINSQYQPSIFPTTGMGKTPREQMSFDRATEEKTYNRNIAQTLGVFLPQYGNILPYGAATPNRTGISASIATDTSLHNITIEANVDLLSEINGEGDAALRKFTGIRGGVLVNLGDMIKVNRLISLSAGVRTENTKRDGNAQVDFKSTVIDGGFAIETFKRVDLLAGVKLLSANGNEFIASRNGYNTITGYTAYLYDGSENIYSGGIRFRFAEYAQASVMYNTTQIVRNKATTNNYTYDQLFMNFTLKF